MFTAQIHTLHACKLSQAKTTERTFTHLRYKQSLLKHPFPKVQLSIAVKCRIYIYMKTNCVYRPKNNDNRK